MIGHLAYEIGNGVIDLRLRRDPHCTWKTRRRLVGGKGGKWEREKGKKKGKRTWQNSPLHGGVACGEDPGLEGIEAVEDVKPCVEAAKATWSRSRGGMRCLFLRRQGGLMWVVLAEWRHDHGALAALPDTCWLQLGHASDQHLEADEAQATAIRVRVRVRVRDCRLVLSFSTVEFSIMVSRLPSQACPPPPPRRSHWLNMWRRLADGPDHAA